MVQYNVRNSPLSQHPVYQSSTRSLTHFRSCSFLNVNFTELPIYGFTPCDDEDVWVSYSSYLIMKEITDGGKSLGISAPWGS